MFDYQAGEKFKLTLIMVGFAGVMAGMLFTMLLMPQQEAPKHHARQPYMNDPDITGRVGRYGAAPAAVSAAAAAEAAGETPVAVAPEGAVPGTVAKTLVEQWLPMAWDLSAGTAKNDQEKAMMYMTADCAKAYRQNIWTADLAQQIEQSGLKSSFSPRAVSVGQTNADGSVVINVVGEQVLNVPGKGAMTKPVSAEYLVKKTPEGLRISGISEGGS